MTKNKAKPQTRVLLF